MESRRDREVHEPISHSFQDSHAPGEIDSALNGTQMRSDGKVVREYQTRLKSCQGKGFGDVQLTQRAILRRTC